MPIDEKGREIVDPKPVSLALDVPQPRSLQAIIARVLRTNASDVAMHSGHESFDEANDFEVDDDPEVKSEYELDDDVDFPEPPKEDLKGEDPPKEASDEAVAEPSEKADKDVDSTPT